MRRLNVKLALWLLGIMVVSVVGVHFLHGYQLERNADFLRLQAEQAEKKGDSKEAIKQYNQYLKYRDDPEGYSALAELVVSSAEGADATRSDYIRAYNILEEAIRRHPDLNDVRRKLIDYTLVMRRIPETLEHIEYLKAEGETDPELDIKTAICYARNGEDDRAIKKLYEIVGYDEIGKQFTAEGGPGAKEVEAYQLLAQLLRRKSDGEKRADEVMDQMVKVNPDSPKARLTRAQYKSLTEGMKGAREDLTEAYSLAKDDADVVLAMAAFSITEKEYDKAQKLLDGALEKHPERQDVYVRLAYLASAQNDLKKAVGYLQQGTEKAKENQLIYPMLLDLLFQMNDFEGARAACKKAEESESFGSEFIRFTEARLKLAAGDFWEASREFESLRPALTRSNYANLTSQLDLFLGKCYEALGLYDRQLDVARRMLQANPGQAGARVAEATALQALGRHAEAAPALELLVANVDEYPFLRPSVLPLLIADQMARPPQQRDWTTVDKMADALAKEPWRGEMDNLMLEAELLMLQERYEDARKLLATARAKDPKDIRVWTSIVKWLQRNNRAESIPALLDTAQKEIGDSPALRALRIRYVARGNAEGGVAELNKLEQSLASTPAQERAPLMLQLGAAYLQLREFESAKRCWKYVVENDSKNAQVRQILFELMSDTKDEAGMQAVMKEIHDSKNWGPQSALYKYCQAVSLVRPIMSRLQGQPEIVLTDAERSNVSEARRLVDEAISMRGEWGPLWRVRAETDQLQGKVDSAIENYQRALQVSKTGQTTVARRLVQLLIARRRYAEADAALKHVGELDVSDPLSKSKQIIEAEQGDPQKALELAEKDLEEDPKNPANHILYARRLEVLGRTDEAEAAYRKAVEMGPNLPQAWLMLVQHLTANKKAADAMKVVGEAGDKLENNPVAMAQLFEVVGESSQAEQFYKSAHEQNPDDLAALRRLVQFYYKSAQTTTPDQFRAQIDKAIPYLDQMIQKTEGSDDTGNARELAWARRTKAEIVASTGGYDQVLAAIKLIEKNRKNGKLAAEDLVTMVALLSKRNDPESRAKAIKALEQLRDQRQLVPREQLLLGQLYERSGNWTQAKDLMVGALSRESNDPDTLIAFARSLIEHGENEEASRWLDRLDALLAKNPTQVLERYKPASSELRAQMLVNKGQPEQAVAVLQQLVPSPLPPNQLNRLEEVSRLLEKLGQYEAAERLLNDYVQQEPRATIAMAAFLGRRGEIDKAFAMLEEARKNQSVIQVLPCALEALRLHPDQKTDERLKTLDDWALAGLQAEPNSQQIKLLMAELYDMQGRYDEVVKLYREVLAAKETTPLQSAVVKNNLAFVLALTRQNAAEAMKLVNESIKLMGPNSDLLDTRGLANLAQGNVEQAVADFRLAATDSPSVSKYVHLAQAEKEANNLAAARDAMAQAEKIGIEPERFTPMEKQQYEALVSELR